jgi:hypothetical protein
VALSKREKIIALATVGVIGLFGADRFVIGPLLERKSDLDAQLVAAEADRDHAAQLFAGDAHMHRRWKEMRDAGLGTSITEAQSQGQRALDEWAREAGLDVSTLQPDPVDRGGKLKDFTPVPLRMIATGSMRSISRFLWSIQTSKIPMRVISSDLSSHGGKDGVDDLALTLNVSTLALNPPPPPNAGKPGAAGAPAAAGANANTGSTPGVTR